MPSMNVHQFVKLWEYALASDFAKDGVPASYADGYSLYWGSESKRFGFGKDAMGGLDLSSDGAFLAMGSGLEVFVYDAASLDLVQRLKGHSEGVTNVQFQPAVGSRADGYRLLSSSKTSAAREMMTIVWELDERGRKKGRDTAQEDSDLDNVAQASVDAAVEKLVAIGHWSKGEDSLKGLGDKFKEALLIADRNHALRNEIVIQGHPASFDSRAFSPDGKAFLVLPPHNPETHHKNRIALYHVETMEEQFPLADHTDNIMWAGFSPDGTMFATVAWDGYVFVYNTANGEQKLKVGPSGGQNWTAAFSHDSQYIAFTKGGGPIYVHRTDDGSLVSTQSEFKRWCRSIAWSPDDRHLLFAAADGKLILMDPFTTDVEQRWELAAREPIMRAFTEAGNVHWLDGGRKFAFTTGEGAVEMYDVDRNVKWRWAPKKGDNWRSGFYSSQMVFDENRKRFFVVDGDCSVRVWDLPV